MRLTVLCPHGCCSQPSAGYVFALIPPPARPFSLYPRVPELYSGRWMRRATGQCLVSDLQSVHGGRKQEDVSLFWYKPYFDCTNKLVSLWHKPYFHVHNLGRTIQSCSIPVQIAMTHGFSLHSNLLPSRKNYEGYIPRTFTSPSFHVPPSLPPLVTQSLAVSANLASSVPQRSDEWFALRKDKLTTSTFSTALGFWKGNRRSELWHEKVFTPDGKVFDATAKAAMNWGVLKESAAIEQYKSITGRDVGFLGFATHTEAKFGWMGASPDGLIDSGILEVKCPYNKGKPELGLPWNIMPYYYMPQVQGQMEIMDRDWVDLYCWTPNGSSIFRVNRDRTYWELMHGVLQEFWWGSVVPARNAVLMGKEDDAKAYEPKPKHELTGLIIGRSRKLAAASRLLCRDIAGHVEFYR